MSAEPSAWQAIAIRFTGDRRWRPLQGAPITAAEAQQMVEDGAAVTAQRRQEDGSLLLLWRPAQRA